MAELTLFGSAIFGIVMIIVLALVLMSSELMQEGRIAVVGAGIFYLLYYYGNDAHNIWQYFTFYNIGFYLLIGVLYSIIRTITMGRKLEGYERKHFDIEANVLRWILMWWVSAIIWLLKDLVADLFSVIWTQIGQFYTYLFNLLQKKKENETNKDDYLYRHNQYN